ncbi:hypothetical protein [Chitinophaga nivalis]|uniref:PKD domain-containing protein n=1 Tax=Chitinophaga nivalis TaxID=2991709 RepID=A0ABT3IGC3_9BACT|nr:hypothetical protein [Chitinophaga nivalis]MCW3467304.1 hypothetical protein [Chitinophaga nivalis]MCW3483004.1 hypothetical protein [Chitinophaga nivalis]
MRFSTPARITCLAIAVTMAACSKKEDTTPEGPATPDYFRPANAKSDAYINQIFEYKPAPGQFTNDPTIGSAEGAKKLIGGTDALVSLGAFGGYVTFGFDHSIENKAGYDLGTVGNPLVNTGMEWSEPGIVMVMQDLNGNGKPDDGEWYELAGSEYNAASTIKNYKITYYNPKTTTATDVLWKDNQGKSGYVLANTYHPQSYFPEFAAGQESIVFEGTLLANTFQKPKGLFINTPLAWGYADNGSKELIDMRNNGETGYNGFDISNAVNSKGEKVNLKYIDFVKLYTGQNCNGSLNADPAKADRLVGEISTEISGAFDVHVKKK